MPTFNEIVEAKRSEVARQKVLVPMPVLVTRINDQKPPLDFSSALRGDDVRLIAEMKQSSPSEGRMRDNFDPIELARIYVATGAAAISVLTDVHFEGDLDHITRIKQSEASAHLPVLRKDFILDEYQVYEARAVGADAILLVVSILTQELLEKLLHESHEIGMQCLVEVHDERELEMAKDAKAEIIGINNRNLGLELTTNRANIEVTERLAPLVQDNSKTIVSESGISTREDVLRMSDAGAHAVLVGTVLMLASDVAEKVRELISDAVPSGCP